jgi:multimeric flavodoxin WrbA
LTGGAIDKTTVFGYNKHMRTAFVMTGSPRPNGWTAKMAAIFSEMWKNAAPGNEMIGINAYAAAVRPCVHCGGCRKTPSCVYDDYGAIHAGFQKADVFVVASPVYGLGFPAPLKAIFDRTQQYFEAKFARGAALPLFKHKKALLLTASGSADPKSAAFMKEELALLCKLLNAELCGVVSVCNTDRVEPDNAYLRGEIAAAVGLV